MWIFTFPISRALTSKATCCTILYEVPLEAPMRLIDYNKHGKNWNPRSVVMFLVAEALSTGFFLGWALMAGAHSHEFFDWMWPLVMAFGSGVGVLQSTLLALHNCPTRPQTAET